MVASGAGVKHERTFPLTPPPAAGPAIDGDDLTSDGTDALGHPKEHEIGDILRFHHAATGDESDLTGESTLPNASFAGSPLQGHSAASASVQLLPYRIASQPWERHYT